MTTPPLESFSTVVIQPNNQDFVCCGIVECNNLSNFGMQAPEFVDLHAIIRSQFRMPSLQMYSRWICVLPVSLQYITMRGTERAFCSASGRRFGQCSHRRWLIDKLGYVKKVLLQSIHMKFVVAIHTGDVSVLFSKAGHALHDCQ